MELNMTRDEAIAASLALDEAQRSCVNAIETIKRKKSWRESEKAMACADYSKRLETLRHLNDKLQQAYSIRGY